MSKCKRELLLLLSLIAFQTTLDQPLLAAPEPQTKDTAIASRQLRARITTTKVHGVDVRTWTHKLKSIQYPVYDGGDSTVCSKLNSAMRGFANRRVMDCWGDLNEWELRSSFVSAKAVSAQFHYAKFGQGAAHQISMFAAFNYQTSPYVKAMNLDDLFGKKVDYKALSPICRKFIASDLKKIGLTEFQFQSPEFPEAQHYEGFSFDNYGVTFAIDMGAESMNGYTVRVPYRSLKNLFAHSSPIYALVTSSSAHKS